MDSQYNQYLQKTGEYGTVIHVSHPIVFIEGLPSVKTHEVILFESGQKGEVFAINRGKIEARILSSEPVRVDTKVTRTDTLLSVPVGRELLGHTITPLGEPIDPADTFKKPKEMRDMEAKPVGIAGRKKITKQMVTGISLIDQLLPLGLGQRELVIGDRKTGKTSLILTVIKSQVKEGVIAIYAAIAKKKSDIKKLQVFFKEEGIMDNMIIVATSSYDSPSLIYQTPYAAMSIAEYFRDQGQNTLLVLDDLSTHAKFYRELSLLARRFPGRDSYPGDVFYVHSRLLERAGNFVHPTKEEVAISCLPVIEIVEGDFTGYISTNVMGITDGHIYLDTNIYYEGRRPAVNIPLSVTRVGRQTLDKLTRELNKTLTTFLVQFIKLQNLSHFGQELTDDVKINLRIGDLIYTFFNQPYQVTIPLTIQLIIISMIMQNIVETKESLGKIKDGLINAFAQDQWQKYLLEIASARDLKLFHKNVMDNKDKLLALGQDPTQSNVPPDTSQPNTPPPPTPENLPAAPPPSPDISQQNATPVPTVAPPPPDSSASPTIPDKNSETQNGK